MSGTRRFVAAALVAALPAVVQAQVLNFEGIGAPPLNTTPIGNFYNGGGGPNYGIEFSSNALAFCLDTPSFTCPTSNTSRGGLGDPTSQSSGLLFLDGPSTLMNRAAGFTSGFSFFYTAIQQSGSFQVFSGLNGTGALLASLALPTTPVGGSGANCLGNGFCPFVAAGVSFAGTARSVVFAGVANQIVFDDVTFGSAVPGVVPGVVPEPSTYVLMATGLGAIVGFARRRRTS